MAVRPITPANRSRCSQSDLAAVFSTGLVETSENFGSQGAPPSHPELLDWLALELIRNDWNIRTIQKQILLSQTYQQSSQFRDGLRERDPENQLYARGPRSRLPAFTLRDQALAVSGLLVEKIGGAIHQTLHATKNLEINFQQQLQAGPR